MTRASETGSATTDDRSARTVRQVVAAQVERIFSTRAPTWCLGLIVLLAACSTALGVVILGSEGYDRIYDEMTYGPAWANGFIPQAVLAIWAVTVVTEHAAGQPGRAALSARVGIIAVFSAVVALIVAYAGFWFTTMVVSLNSDWLPYVLPADHVRQFGQHALLTALACVASASVGIVLRRRGVAVLVVILWPVVWFGLVFRLHRALHEATRARHSPHISAPGELHSRTAGGRDAVGPEAEGLVGRGTTEPIAFLH